jgi:hypothetical protein
VTATVVRFPPRRLAAVWILPLAESGWLVLLGSQGWLHGGYDDAIADAAWLGRNTGLPTRRAAVAKRIDLIGKRFGRWVVLAYAQDQKWSCVCDCGARAVVNGQNLRKGRTKSCGCLSRELHRIDLVGKRFGRWIVRAYAGGEKWSCVCDCGARAVLYGHNLRTGRTKSCGCLRKELATKHGMERSKEYRAWSSMKQRCFNPNAPAFKNYGGRGISVCKDWFSFEGFFPDMGACPPGLSLDRIDVNGNYESSNCRWANASQQNRNRRPPRTRTAAKRRRREQVERMPPPLDDPPF